MSEQQYNPNEPVGSKSRLKEILEHHRSDLVELMPKHLNPDRLIKSFMVAANRDPKVLGCTVSSVIECALKSASTGLEVSGTLGEAYLVPHNKNIGNRQNPNWVSIATFIPGYVGLAKLARNSGEVKRIEAEIVYENDEFEYRKGTDFRVSFVPNLRGDRGSPLGAYSLVELKNGSYQAEWMSYDEIESVRARSKSAWDRNGNPIGPWRTDWGQMAKKTPFRRMSKWLDLESDRFHLAVNLDNADYEEAFNQNVNGNGGDEERDYDHLPEPGTMKVGRWAKPQEPVEPPQVEPEGESTSPDPDATQNAHEAQDADTAATDGLLEEQDASGATEGQGVGFGGDEGPLGPPAHVRELAKVAQNLLGMGWDDAVDAVEKFAKRRFGREARFITPLEVEEVHKAIVARAGEAPPVDPEPEPEDTSHGPAETERAPRDVHQPPKGRAPFHSEIVQFVAEIYGENVKAASERVQKDSRDRFNRNAKAMRAEERQELFDAYAAIQKSKETN